MGALQLKAEAFANKSWNEYWKGEGPSLLAGGWVNTHPLIPLRRVEEVCAINFLSCAMTQIDLTFGNETTSVTTIDSHEGSQGLLSTDVQTEAMSETFLSSPRSASNEVVTADEPREVYGLGPNQEESDDGSEHTTEMEKAWTSSSTLPEGVFVPK